MRRLTAVLVIAILALVGLLRPADQPSAVQAQSTVCETAGAEVPMRELGSPDAEGVTVPQIRLASPTDRVAYRFVVAAPRTGFVYVGDQWYDLDLALYSITRSQTVACWQTLGARARSERHERRQIQFVRPDEQIIENLEPGVYVLTAGAVASSDFDAGRGFTVRVALGPTLCGSLDPPNVPHPRYPGLAVRAADAWYQLGMSVRPEQPGPFDLVTFSAFVSPPYTDLFDFEWELDGQRIPGAEIPTVQLPARALLGDGARGTHSVRVTARGARAYPDPEQTHIPPTLSVSCSFWVVSETP
jgi:hypothetical protein